MVRVFSDSDLTDQRGGFCKAVAPAGEDTCPGYGARQRDALPTNPWKVISGVVCVCMLLQVLWILLRAEVLYTPFLVLSLACVVLLTSCFFKRKKKQGLIFLLQASIFYSYLQRSMVLEQR